MDKQIPNTTCPLCGKPNQCAISAGQRPAECWCMTATISPQARKHARQSGYSDACLCPHCGRSGT